MQRPCTDMGRIPALLLALLLVAACAGDLPRDYGNPAQETGPSLRNGIFAQLLAPDPLRPASEATAELRFAAWTEDAQRVVLRDPARGVPAARSGEAGPDQVHTLDVPLLHGWNAIRLEARSAEGRWRTLETRLRYEGERPGVRIEGVAPGVDCETRAPHAPAPFHDDTLCVFVRTSTPDDSGVRVDIQSGDQVAVRAVQTGDGRHVARVDVPTDGDHPIQVFARGDAGDTRADLQVLRDSAPPRIELAAPQDGLQIEAASLRVEAVFDAPSGIDEATLLLGERVIARRRGVERIDLDVPLPTGAHVLVLRVRDRAGNVAEERRSVLRAPPIRLGLPREGAEATLRIDRFALEDLLSPEARDALVLGAIELREVTRSALLAIREPARFGVDTSAWGTSEWNLSRLLAMTPDDAELDGTALEPLRDLATALGLPPARLLAELLDVAVDEPLLPLDDITDAVLDLLIGSHPAVGRSEGVPALQLVLTDALTDLAPLADRFGPDGAHPGFLDGGVRGRIIEEGFFLELLATSTLRRHEGISLARRAKAYCFTAEGDDLIEVDFEDPDAFRVVGVVDEPRVDLRLLIREHPAFVPAGTDREANPLAERPGYALGDSPLWSLQPWELERIIAEAALRRFLSLDDTLGPERSLRYDIGAISDAAVVRFDRGWVTFETAGNLGNPPPPAYAWDLLTEIAQVRLHDGGLAQGDVDIAIDLRDVPVGLDAADLEAILRPELQAQRSSLVANLLGTEPAGQGDCDLQLVDIAGGALIELLRSPEAGATRTLQPGRTTRVEDDEGSAWSLTLGTLSGEDATFTLRPEVAP